MECIRVREILKTKAPVDKNEIDSLLFHVSCCGECQNFCIENLDLHDDYDLMRWTDMNLEVKK